MRDAFILDAKDLTRSAINGIRVALGIAGAVALGLGILLFARPDKTLEAAATILGIYFVIAGAVRLLTGLFSRGIRTNLRLLSIVLGLLLIAAGVIALKNTAVATAALLLVAVAVIGVGWIIDGVMAIAESGMARSAGWAVAYGIVSILGGIAVLAVPGWSAFWLVAFTAGVLVVLGLIGIVRAVTFGRGALKAMGEASPMPGSAAAY
jgi:uncharacterized membrane protein HdeD (DUF308 family)